MCSSDLIMLRPTDQLALVDFGTVRPMTSTYFAKVAGQRDITSVVSPGYTPLEQINGRAVPQSDFYALGRSFVYLLTGTHPIDLPEDDTTGQITWRDQVAEPVDLWFAQLLDDMMAPFPGQRPLNAEALLERLTNPQSPQVDSEQPKPWVKLLLAANVGLLLLQFVVGWQWWAARQRLENQALNQPKTTLVAMLPSQSGPAA